MFGRRLPADIVAAVPDLKGDGKVLAWARGPERLSGEPTVVVATQRAFHAPGFVGRVEWQHILKASWENPILEVVTITGPSTKLVRLRLDNAGSIPQVVNERVTASIVMQRHIELVGKAGASLVARRTPDSDEIRWEVVFDPGLDVNDQALRDHADEELAWLRESVGI